MMMKTEHTPGPWWIEAEESGTYAILAQQGPLEVCPAKAHSLTDARLIASAPELLKVLERAMFWEGKNMPPAVRKQAEAIIDRARGRVQE